MLLPVRRVQLLPLFCAVCHLTLGFPTQTPSVYDDVRSLQVNIPHSGAILASLGSSISISCLVSLPTAPLTSSISPLTPRVKWSVVSGGEETQILVVRGERVRVNEAYRDRAALLNHTSSPDDWSLWLGDLRSSDSGHYRCEVQHGLEDASDLVELKVKGVVFHYRDALGRYAFTYHQAQRACEAIGAEIATAEQLLAAYYDGYEQCDAGWLADQSVRYPIQVPREGCYGDMDGQPGVRNYGTMAADDLFDAYCYVEQIDGEVFYDSVPQQLSFDEAQSYCRAAGAELATTAQLYLAWSEGLDRCSPGWLSDGSVRYPITTPRERCGGPQAGVKSLYRFSNQSGFPEPSSLHDVYCFRGNRHDPTDSPTDYVATEPEDIGQNVVILTDADQELQLNQQSEQVEREAQSALESFPFVSSPSSEENLFDTHTTESSLNATSTLDLLQLFNETASPAEMSSGSQHPTALVNSNISSTETYDHPQNTSLPSVYSETDSHHGMNTVHLSETESTTGSTESSNAPYAINETVPDTLNELVRVHSNYSGRVNNQTEDENILHVTPVTSDITPQVHLDEAALEDSEQISLSTQSPSAGTEFQAMTTQSPIKQQTSLWLHIEGSGDISPELDPDIESPSVNSTSVSFTSDSTTHLSTSASAGSATAEPWTEASDVTQSPGSQKTDKLPIPTSAQLWESAVSRQEGSSSLEAEDMFHIEVEEKKLYYTTPGEKLVSVASLGSSESPEPFKTPQLPTDFPTAQYRTTDYRGYLSTATNAFEEASGQEPGVAIATLGEDSTVAFKDDLEVIGNIGIVPTLEEEFNISIGLEEEANASSLLEKEVKGSPTVALKEGPPLEEGLAVTPPLDEAYVDTAAAPKKEAEAIQKFEEETELASAIALEEVTATTAPTLQEELSIAPTLEEEAKVVDEVEDKVVDEVVDEAKVAAVLEGELRTAPTLQAEAKTVSTLEEDTEITLSPDDGGSFLEEGPISEATLKEEASLALTLALSEDAKASPTTQEDFFTVTPFHSFPSTMPMLTTTARPQQSLNEYSRKPPSLTTTVAPASLTSTRSNAASTKTATRSTTTHLYRRVWSPTTSTARASEKTTEPEKVTHLMPPVDHVEFSLTQLPTLLILPSERAAVGDAGKSSDPCDVNPCLNGGTCTIRHEQIQCLCLPTYGGDHCQSDLERCEPGWDKFHGFCYRHFNQRLSWEVAEKQCRLMGAHLVSILSPEEQNYISSKYKEYQWTGLNDKTIEDDFRWSDGNPLLYENWYRGQPDSYFLSGEDCVVMVWHDDGRWSDVPCNYHLAYTCKKSTSSCGPPPKVRNASLYGKVRQRYETNALVRYYCAQGFQQSLSPLIRCLPGGRWERPQILCIPVGLQTKNFEELINLPVMEFEFEATTEKPEYWDIKF